MGRKCQFRRKNGCDADCMNQADSTKGISTFSLSTWDVSAALNLLALLGFSTNYVYNPKSFSICSEHFSPDSIETSGANGRRNLKKNPTVLGAAYTPLSSTIDSFQTLVKGLHFFFDGKLPPAWSFAYSENQLSLYKMEWTSSGVIIAQQISMGTDFIIKWFVNGIPMNHRFNNIPVQDLTTIVNFMTEIVNAAHPPQPSEQNVFDRGLELVKTINWEHNSKAAFDVAMMIMLTIDITAIDNELEFRWNVLLDQLKNLFVTPTQRRFSWSTRLAASFIKNVSCAAYELLRNYFVLPTTRSLRSLAHDLHAADNKSFFMTAASRLSEAEKVIQIAVDEIALDPRVEYKTGKITGLTEDGKVAKTAQGFFASSVAGHFSELVALRPVNGCTAKKLVEMLIEVILMMQECGFTVVVIVTDNHPINQSMFKLLTGGNKTWFTNPGRRRGDSERKIFCRFDQVHLFKNIRNCWLNLKDFLKTMVFPIFDDVIKNPFNERPRTQEAQFAHIRKMFFDGVGTLVKCAHRLTRNVCFPSVFEKQNVKLVDRLFARSTAAALVEKYGDEVNGTFAFLTLWRRWFDIQNAKNPNECFFPDRMPIRKHGYENNASYVFLKQMVTYLEVWSRLIASNPFFASHGFTKMTINALLFTTQSSVDYIDYIFVHHPEVKYILLGKISSDPIEGCFGKLRWLSGSNYRISVTQALESLKKLRMRSMLSWLVNDPELKIWEEEDDQVDELTERTWEKVKDVIYTNRYMNALPSIPATAVVHIAGFAASRAYLRIKGKCCDTCFRLLADSKGGFIQGDVYQNLLQLGTHENEGLTIPSRLAINLAHQLSMIIQTIHDSAEYKIVFDNPEVQKQHIMWKFADECLRSTDADPEKVCDDCQVQQGVVLKWFIRCLSNTLLVAYKNVQNEEFAIAEQERKGNSKQKKGPTVDWLADARQADNQQVQAHLEDVFVASTPQQTVRKMRVLNQNPSRQAITRAGTSRMRDTTISESEAEDTSDSEYDEESDSDVSMMSCDD